MEIKEHQGLRKIVQKNEENPTEIQYTPTWDCQGTEKNCSRGSIQRYHTVEN